jgi:hypothetical protein
MRYKTKNQIEPQLLDYKLSNKKLKNYIKKKNQR